MKIKDLFFFRPTKKSEKTITIIYSLSVIYLSSVDRETVLIQFNYEKMEDFLFFFFSFDGFCLIKKTGVLPRNNAIRPKRNGGL